MDNIRRPGEKNTLDLSAIKRERPPVVEKPRNIIEEALRRNQKQIEEKKETFLPDVSPKPFNYDEPLKIITEPFFEPKVEETKPETRPEVPPKQMEREVPQAEISFKEEVKKTRKISRFTIRVALIVLVAVALLYGGFTLFQKFTSPVIATNETALILADISKGIELPINEDPTIMTVTNLTPLKSQAFFKDAVVGDKVVVYSKAKKAILYRPSEKRVIVVAPLNQ